MQVPKCYRLQPLVLFQREIVSFETAPNDLFVITGSKGKESSSN